MYFSIEALQRDAFDSALYNHAVDISRATDLGILGNIEVNREALIDPNKVFPFALGRSLVQFRSIDGAILLSSDQLGQTALPLNNAVVSLLKSNGFIIESVLLPDTARGAIGDFFRSRGHRNENLARFRLLHYLINKKGIPPLILQVAVPTALLDREQQDLLKMLMVLIPLALLAATITGLVISKRALIGVNRIIQSARSIGPSELSARVPVPPESELNALAHTLNAMLDRLQRTFESQDQFVADASHQLKTPLAILRGELDVFGQSARTPAEAQALHESLSQEVNHLSRTVDNLLTLARFDSNKPGLFSLVRLDEVLFETISSLQKQAKSQNVELLLDIDEKGLSSAHAFETFGDADLLRTMLFNFIENSIKYARADHAQTKIRLTESTPRDTLKGIPQYITGTVPERGPESASASGSEWLILIEDNGIGINEDNLKRIFDRFFRVTDLEKPSRNLNGVGLGLAIAARIADYHKIQIDAFSQVGVVTRFLLRIKKI